RHQTNLSTCSASFLRVRMADLSFLRAIGPLSQPFLRTWVNDGLSRIDCRDSSFFLCRALESRTHRFRTQPASGYRQTRVGDRALQVVSVQAAPDRSISGLH